MSKAKVLYVNVTGVSSEILKNLVLAGIRAVLCDTRPYPDAVEDTPSFLLPPSRGGITASGGGEEPASKRAKTSISSVARTTVAEAVRPVVEELNPLLGTCEVVSKSVGELDEDFVSQVS